MIYNSNDTIVALATPNGAGAIACIRIAGKESIKIVSEIFEPLKGKTFAESAQATMRLGNIMHNGSLVDEVLAAVFRAPHSYTGDDAVEIYCHGSSYIIQKILSILIGKGCRTATPGEYTQRAFLNGKMDLSQAEAVADLIASSSAASHKVAITQMRGGFGNKLKELRAKLLNFVSLIELELDFSEEDVEFANRESLSSLADNISEAIKKLIESFSAGNALKNGIPVAIVGETNAGKSTLLNLLLHDEKAIVSDVHGTTRDVIEDTMNINGMLFRFIDTAGIRDTSDTIESMGIERTYKKINEANIILWLVDINSTEKQIVEMANKIIPLSQGKTLVLIFNKIDSTNENIESKKHFLEDKIPQRIFISAKMQTNIAELESLLSKVANIPNIDAQDIIVTNIRHYSALQKSHEAITRVQSSLQQNISIDLLTQDIRECVYNLGEITGEICTGEVLSNIFEKFCIGK